MNIVILRHGEAQTDAPSDAERQLTEYGREQAIAAGQCLLQQGLLFDTVWISPYTRAQQTASAALGALLGEDNIGTVSRITQEFLTPDNNPSAVLEAIDGCSAQNLLIVSHQPLVSALVGVLLDADHRAGPPMSPATMVSLSAEVILPGCCELQWLRHAPTFEVVP